MRKKNCRNYMSHVAMLAKAVGMRYHSRKPYFTEKEYDAAMQAHETGLCFCGSGKPHTQCHETIRNDSIFAYAMRNLMDIEKRIHRLAQQERIKPYCRKGCNECCGDYFYCSETEYFLLRNEMIERGMLESMIEVGSRQIERLRQRNEAEYARLTSDQKLEETCANYGCVEQWELCPLNQNKLCVCYENRPSICRIYGYSGECGVCGKVKKRLRRSDGTPNQAKIEKRLIGEPVLTEENSMFLGYFPVRMQCKTVGFAYIPARPIAFWLSMDGDLEKKYADALALPVEEYGKKYYG